MIQKFTKLSVVTSLVLACCLFVVSSVAQTFNSTGGITINDVSSGTPNPSVITVAGGPASIGVISITLNSISHTWPNDVDVLLVAPNGESLVIMSDVGTGADWIGDNLTIADFGAALFSDLVLNPTGTYQPTNYTAGDAFPGFGGTVSNPAPAGAQTFSSMFGGDVADGDWSLYVVDDVGGDTGSIGSWSITFINSIPGCTDPSACNYDAAANENDGSCVFPGCTDPGASNFDPTAGCDDGNCCYDFAVTINMFDAFGDGWNGYVLTVSELATGTPVGSAELVAGDQGVATLCLPQGCYTVDVAGGIFAGEVSWEIITFEGLVLSGGAPASGLILSVGEVCIPGCMDLLATNYDPNATIDDGSCVYCAPGEQLLVFSMTDAFGDGWNGAQYFIADDGGNIVASGSLDAAAAGDNLLTGIDTWCLATGCYNVTVTSGSWAAEVGWSLQDQNGNEIAGGGAPVTGVAFAWAGATGCTIPGCTDPGCNNYNPQANQDDGSCECPPANDDCANAEAIGCGVTVAGSTINSNDDSAAAGDCQGIAITSPGVWYTFIGTGEQVTLTTCASGVDSKISVYAGACGALACVAANDDDPACTGFASTVTFTSQAAVQYFVLVSEFGAGVGIDFELVMTCTTCANVPINDDCASALPLPDGAQVPGNLCCANPDDISGCNPFGTGYGVWYTMNSGSFDTFDFTLQNVSGTNAGLVVFEDLGGGCANLNPIACCGPVVDQCAGSLFAANIPVTQNTQYYFLVYTNDAVGCGDFTLIADLTGVGCTDPLADNYDPINTIEDGSCTYTSAPANDLCADAEVLSCGATVNGTTSLSTATGAPTACGLSAGDNGVWYTFEGTGEFHTISTCGSAIDTRIEVLSSTNGCAGPMTCVVSEDDDATDTGCGFFDGDDAVVDFISTVGTTYFVYITAGSVDTNGDFINDLFDGSFQITFDCAPVLNGCTNPCACNYDANANVDDNSCEYFSCVTCTNGVAVMMDMTDAFGDGWNGATYTISDLAGNIVAEGSIDAAQCSVDNDNFAGPETGFDVFCLEDGCYTITVGGGTWDAEVSWSLNDASGNPIVSGIAETLSFTVGAGVCGCTDPGACNYDAAATDDNGTCEYTTCAGCTDATACNYDASASIADPASCCYENCVTLIMNDSFGDGWNGNTAVIVDESTGQIVATATLPDGTTGTVNLCLEDGCYRITVGGGIFAGEVSYILTGTNNGIITGGVNATGVQFSTGSGNCTPGCLEPLACNYDPTAGLSDCSLCDYSACSGCTYAQADNYDPTATIDDNSCIFNLQSSCPEDLNQDGVIGVADLIQLLGVFGSNCN
jgi:subtilisin-like proprotein convertase family protein